MTINDVERDEGNLPNERKHPNDNLPKNEKLSAESSTVKRQYFSNGFHFLNRQ